MDSSKPKRKYNDQTLRHVFPKWYVIIYGTACAVLIPWTIFLSIVLPPHYVSEHWDAAWAGFDAFETILFALTAIFALKHSIWTAFTSIMLGTTLLIDAWFDVLTARSHNDTVSAYFTAFALEIPLAILSLFIAHRVVDYAREKHQIK